MQRDENKDGYHVLVAKDYSLFFIFDGVSSSKNAKLGVNTLIEFCDKSHEMYYQNREFHLSHLIEDMNICLLKGKSEDMHTTCCILFLPHDENLPVKFTHLGDSRIYGIRQNLNQYTEDHNDPVLRNMLTKCLGLKRLVTEDFYEKKMDDLSEKIFLCTDGFYNVMESDPGLFLKLFKSADMKTIHEQIKNAIFLKNSDDATYILISFTNT